ncbi:hypothetical protein IMZ48_25795 [Candidatus Bathyarchaeota archaeon]|nr:hypothetical protein [Candidatus Bathyarchaeota archaeon]
MLRRQPTTLTITAEDIAAYEDRRAKEAEAERRRARGEDAEMAEAEAEAGRVQARRTKDERIGVSRRGRR